MPDVRWHVGNTVSADDMIALGLRISREANADGCFRPEADIAEA